VAVYSLTLAQLRQSLSRKIHDLELFTCEAGSDATHFVSSYMAAKDANVDDYFNNWEAHVYEGTNGGNARQVTDWDHATKKGTIAPAFANALDITSKIELRRETKAAELNDFINEAIDMVPKEIQADIVNETIALVAVTREYTLPLTIFSIDKITMESSTSGIYKTEDVIDPRDYDLLRGYPPKLWFKDRYVPTADRHLRIEGRAAQKRLETDADICFLPPAYIIFQAKMLYHASRAGGDHRQLMLAAQAMADRCRNEAWAQAPGVGKAQR